MPAPSIAGIEEVLARGITLEQTLLHLAPGVISPDSLPVWVAAYRSIYNSGLGIEASTPYPGIAELLEFLFTRSVFVAVASNKGEESVRATLEKFDLSGYISLVVAATGAQPTKPDPLSFHQRIVPALGASAVSKMIVIGDTDTDIRYARSIGALSCWAAYGYGSPEVCLPLVPDFVAHYPAEVGKILS